MANEKERSIDSNLPGEVEDKLSIDKWLAQSIESFGGYCYLL